MNFFLVVKVIGKKSKYFFCIMQMYVVLTNTWHNANKMARKKDNTKASPYSFSIKSKAKTNETFIVIWLKRLLSDIDNSAC